MASPLCFVICANSTDAIAEDVAAQWKKNENAALAVGSRPLSKLPC